MKRYSLFNADEYFEHERGAWVRFDDAEALIAERDAARFVAVEMSNRNERTSQRLEQIYAERDDARAKLAIAVEALREIVDNDSVSADDPWRFARATLAKIEADPLPRCPHYDDNRTDCAQCWEGE
jgi:hypothetical protein